MMNEMEAVRYSQFGGPEVLKVERVKRPEPKEEEVLVCIHSSGVLPIDWKIRQGWMPMPVHFPVIPGSAFAGVIEKVGTSVTEFKVGQEVFGRTTNGSYAAYTTVSTSTLALKPKSIGFDEAAAISGGATTAWQVLFNDGNIKTGDRILIHGAAGGVGLFAVQFAKWKGAHVTATAGPANLDYVRSIGADAVIDYTSTQFEKVVQDMDFVLDTVGGETLEKSWSVIRQGGALISIAGQPSLERAQEEGVRLIKPSRAFAKKDLETIAKLMDEGKVKGFVGQKFSLHEVAQAHELSQRGHGRGRIILQIVE
ncbi:NADP-dependent oxidoreductase [Psychrobacillus sp. NPDC058041]|uniref:NADP-dependent oxidoreductase n=1 Tax=Psychrobacillus sp. NPDC058041 TaxID=3346310 RepID=UPI0036DCBD9B